jgi:hypothetical protein
MPLGGVPKANQKPSITTGRMDPRMAKSREIIGVLTPGCGTHQAEMSNAARAQSPRSFAVSTPQVYVIIMSMLPQVRVNPDWD